MESRKTVRNLLPNGGEKYDIFWDQRKESGNSKNMSNPRYILKVEQKEFTHFSYEVWEREELRFFYAMVCQGFLVWTTGRWELTFINSNMTRFENENQEFCYEYVQLESPFRSEKGDFN